MKFCQEHWDQLREAIKARDMERFVAKSGEQAAQQMVDDINGTTDPTIAYDPLMAMHWAIASKVMEMLGPNSVILLHRNPEHPEYECPLCLVKLNTENCKCGCSDHVKEWVDSCADHFLNEFKQNGWIKEPEIN